jgi:hypothetical protein
MPCSKDPASDRRTVYQRPVIVKRTEAARTAELGNIGLDTLLPISPKPEGIGVIVAGGAGTHTVYIPGFGPTRSITREVIFAG